MSFEGVFSWKKRTTTTIKNFKRINKNQLYHI